MQSTDGYAPANGSGAAVRAAIGADFQALNSNNLGATAPPSPVAGMWWPDTTTGWLKQRDTTNSVWIKRCKINGDAVINVAAASGVIDLGADGSRNINLTGTGNITGLGASAPATDLVYYVNVQSTPVLKYNATALVTEGEADILCAPGDVFLAIPLGSGNWKIGAYFRGDGGNFRLFGGDSGAGGAAGLVPAPGAGDGAAGKVLLATGLWGLASALGGIGNVKLQSFPSSSIYTPTAGMKFALVLMAGGGGNSNTVTTANGGTTSLGALLTAAGGHGAIGGVGGTGGTGGTGTGLHIAGVNGQSDIYIANSCGVFAYGSGVGHSSFWGIWGKGADGVQATSLGGSGGGGAGEVAIGVFSAATIGAPPAVTIGAGGTASGTNNAGQAGGCIIIEFS